MKQVAVFGVGGCGRSVMPLARIQLGNNMEGHDLVFVDDNPSASVCNGQSVYTYADWLSMSSNRSELNIAIAVASGAARKKISERCVADGVQFYEIRAANIVVLDDVKIGEGAILCPFVFLGSNISIGKHFHANISSYVEHDCVVGDYVTLGPGVKCNGNVVLEDHVYIGAGAVIKQGQSEQPLVIGRGAVIGMGAVVTKSVPPGATMVGNPARPLLKNELTKC
jgi:sugar O-acyltransferase (sialic acid O-acetyltransferase NeuD family)